MPNIFAPKNFGACASIAPEYRSLPVPTVNTVVSEKVATGHGARCDAFTVTSPTGTASFTMALASNGTMTEASGATGSVQFTWSGLCPGDAYPCAAVFLAAASTNTTVNFLFQG